MDSAVGSNQDIVIPELPDRSLKVGKFIRTAMQQLSSSGYMFSKSQLEKLCDKAWSKKTFHTNWPFMKRKQADGETQLRDANGRMRYWVDSFVFGDVEVYVTKELFQESGSMECFIEWYERLRGGEDLD